MLGKTKAAGVLKEARDSLGKFLYLGWEMMVEVKVSLGTKLPVPQRTLSVSDKNSLILLPCQGPLLVSDLTYKILR